MPVFVDPRTGEVYANVPDEDAERAQREFGLVPEADFDHQIAVKEADKGFGSAVSGGLQRGLGAIQDALQGFTPPAVGSDAFGMGGPAPAAAPAAEVQSGAETFPAAYSEEAQLQREARPFAAGIGTSLAVAPLAAMAGAGAGALAAGAGAGALLGTAGAVVTEAAVEGVVQEYDDAWFEERPYELSQVAANTLMFAGLDFAFRGALKGLGSALGSGRKAGAIGGRNVVSEAQGAARELVDPVSGGSVGAASASDLAEPFDDAIRQMSDRDAAVLARDADAHYQLIAQDSSEAFTRLNNGLSDSLGNRLKIEDFATYAQEFDAPTLERQAGWWTGVSEEADAAARRINALAEGDKTALDFGNLGKKATQTIDDFNRRIAESTDPGQRIVLIDDFKKALDRLTMSVDASRSVDTVTRNELKALIAPTRETLRKGLENAKLFGGAADLQKSLNAPWHGLLEHWSKVQKTLTEETGHIQFDVSGAGRISRESTVDRMLSLLGKDPRQNQEFGRHLAGALENIQGLIDARQANGISRLDGLDAMGDDIRNLMEDWNLASTIGVAKNRVDAIKKDPRKWGTLALNLGERLPIVGQPIQLARTLGDAFTDLHIQRGTPLARVWDSAYKRYALNPAYSDPSIIRNYPDWIADSLRNRGGSFTPPPAGVAGSPVVPGMPPANANAQRNVASPPAPAAATGKSAIDRARARASQGGSVQLSGSIRERQGFDALPGDAQNALKSAAFNAPQKAFTKEAKDELRDSLFANTRLSESDRKLAIDFVDSIPDELQWNGKLARKYGRLIGRRGEGRDFQEELMRHVEGRLVPDDPMMKRLYHDRKLRDAFIRGVDHGTGELEKTGRPLDSSAFRSIKETLERRGGQSGAVSVGEGQNFTVSDIAKSPMGVVTGAGAAGLAINAAVQQRAEQPPDSPTHAYRDALREIDRAGSMQVRAMASEALRKRPPRGKDRDPLALFAGKRRIQDAVEETRERLDEIAADPTTLLQQLGSSSGALSKTHPSVHMAVVQKAAQVAAYLQGSLPARTSVTLLDPVGAAPSFDRAWDYAARYVGATQPRAALREVVRGSAPPEMLEAVQQTWPELWSAFQVEMLGQVQRMHSAGRHIPSEKLRRLDKLLGMGGQLDPSASLDVARHFLAAQDADAAKREQAAQGGGKAPAGGSARAALRTKLDSVNQERT